MRNELAIGYEERSLHDIDLFVSDSPMYVREDRGNPTFDPARNR